MAFIGTPLDTRNTFQSLVGKRFDGDASTTAFTLDVAPSSVLDIEVFVGNVRQDPNSAYTLSGTTLTFTGAPPSGTNNIYVVHQAKSVGTIDVPSAGVQSGSLASAFLTGQTDIGADIADADLFLVDDGAGGTLRKTAASRLKTYAGFSVSSITGATALAVDPASDDEYIINDGGTLKRIDYKHVSNSGKFMVYDASVTVADATNTIATGWSETYDLDGFFASDKYTPTVAGYYYLAATARANNIGATARFIIGIRKNGAALPLGGYDAETNIVASSYPTVSNSAIVYADGDDYFEVNLYQNSGGSTALFDVGFWGFKLS